MALISGGNDNKADKIASGSISERPTGAAGMIRHCTTRREITEEPGSILEYYDPTSHKWQQLASFFAVEGVEVYTDDDVKHGYFGRIPADPIFKEYGKVSIPAGFDKFFIVASMGFQMMDATYDPSWGQNSAQMSLMINGKNRSDIIGYMSTQSSRTIDEYGQDQKFPTSCSASIDNPKGRDAATFYLTANQQSTSGSYCTYDAYDTNLAVLAWRTVRN